MIQGSWGDSTWGSSSWGGAVPETLALCCLRAASSVTKPSLVAYIVSIVPRDLQTTPTVTRPSTVQQTALKYDCVGYSVTGSISYTLVGTSGWTMVCSELNSNVLNVEDGYELISCSHNS